MTPPHSDSPSVHQVLILGGGFTGLFAALHLSRLNPSCSITLVDESPRFVFKPLLYELLTGEMHGDQVCPSFVELLQRHNIRFLQATVTSIDLAEQIVRSSTDHHYSYGFLVLALGSVSGFFGIEGAEQNSYPFRTDRDVARLSDHMRSCLQRAVAETDEAERRALTTFTVVGAGPSGVEMAGTLGDLLPIWYSDLGGDPKTLRIVLMNRSGAILKGDINEQLRQDATAALGERTVPVDLLLNAAVRSVQPGSVQYEKEGENHHLPTATVIWTAGSATHPLLAQLAVPEGQRDRHGRLRVKENLQLPDHPNVFAGGDCAAEPSPLPPTAQVAYQQGRAIAHGLVRRLHGQPAGPLPVHIRGSMLKLGIRDSAVHLFGRFELTGITGHLIRQATYLELLPTPLHDIRATAEWLRDETFHRYVPPTERNRRGWARVGRKWIVSLAVLLLVATGLFLIGRQKGTRPLPPSDTPSTPPGPSPNGP